MRSKIERGLAGHQIKQFGLRPVAEDGIPVSGGMKKSNDAIRIRRVIEVAGDQKIHLRILVVDGQEGVPRGPVFRGACLVILGKPLVIAPIRGARMMIEWVVEQVFNVPKAEEIPTRGGGWGQTKMGRRTDG